MCTYLSELEVASLLVVLVTNEHGIPHILADLCKSAPQAIKAGELGLDDCVAQETDVWRDADGMLQVCKDGCLFFNWLCWRRQALLEGSCCSFLLCIDGFLVDHPALLQSDHHLLEQ